MRDVIQRVMEAEREGKRMVETARAEAERIVAEARKAAEEAKARTQRESRTEAERIVEAATREAEQEKRERLARATAEIGNELQLDDASRQRAVEAVLRCVCGFH